MNRVCLHAPRSMGWGRQLLALGIGLSLLAGAARAVEDDWDDTGLIQRNNPRVLSAFRPAVGPSSQSTVRVLSDGKPAALGIMVGADGWILSKASELKGKLVCRFRDGTELPARLVRENDAYDLALLRVESRKLTPVEWCESSAAPVGNWVASPGMGRDPVAIGVVSVAARKLPQPKYPWEKDVASSGYLGIGLASDSDDARVGKIMPHTPAARAGLKVNDKILSIGGKDIPNGGSLLATLQSYRPGTIIIVRVKRDDEEKEFKIKLARRPPDRSDFQNHLGSQLSGRRRGFPTILQHDTILKPSECGGPLVDLEGNVIGINIARAGRTESYALPSEVIPRLLDKLSSGKLRPGLVRKKTGERKEVRSAKIAVEE